MANPPKQKGTGGERELVRAFDRAGRLVARTSPGLPYDIYVSPVGLQGRKVDALATRPDHGQWLVTIRLQDFIDLLGEAGARVESKRYKRFSLHTIFDQKFGRGA